MAQRGDGEKVCVCLWLRFACLCVSIECSWTKGWLEHAVLLCLIFFHRQKDDQISDVVFPSVCTVTSTTDLLNQCCHVAPLQCSGWWPSESWEEGQRSVWVRLCHEHSHRVLLPYPGERCVCLCHCTSLFFSIFCSIFPSVSNILSLRPRQPFIYKTLDLRSWPLTHGCVLSVKIWHVYASVSSRSSLSVECSILGEPSDLLSGAAHPVPARIQLGKSSQEWKVHANKCTHTHSAT